LAPCSGNRAIEAALVVSPKTVEAHIRQIFMKLGFDEAPDRHRRVLAVLTYLRRRT
jgi:DNA-binding NarL/FixJ family response regulator